MEEEPEIFLYDEVETFLHEQDISRRDERDTEIFLRDQVEFFLYDDVDAAQDELMDEAAVDFSL